MIGETILVIDSDTETTQKMVSILEAEDYLVFTAPGGDVGITMAKKVNPTLIFVNPAIAGTSGLEVCKTIHGIETLKNAPIIVLSAFEGAMDPRYTSIYGIVGSLKKPFSPEELISKTKNILSMKSFDVQSALEEDFGFGEAEEAVAIEKPMTPDIQKEIVEEADISDSTVIKPRKEIDITDRTAVKMKEDIEFPDKTVVKQVTEKREKEKTEHIQIPRTESEKTTEVERERTYVLKRNTRRRGMGNRLLVPIIAAAVIITLGAAGFVLYKKGLLPGIKAQAPVAAKPSKPVQQETAKVTLSQEQQKPQQAVTEKKPALTVPAPAPKPEPKPSGKITYSVQVGAFKNESNATTLTKQYKDKGYESFIYKAQKDKEILYRVLIGKFENRKEASKLAESISLKEKTKAIIFKE